MGKVNQTVTVAPGDTHTLPGGYYFKLHKADAPLYCRFLKNQERLDEGTLVEGEWFRKRDDAGDTIGFSAVLLRNDNSTSVTAEVRITDDSIGSDAITGDVQVRSSPTNPLDVDSVAALMEVVEGTPGAFVAWAQLQLSPGEQQTFYLALPDPAGVGEATRMAVEAMTNLAGAELEVKAQPKPNFDSTGKTELSMIGPPTVLGSNPDWPPLFYRNDVTSTAGNPPLTMVPAGVQFLGKPFVLSNPGDHLEIAVMNKGSSDAAGSLYIEGRVTEVQT